MFTVVAGTGYTGHRVLARLPEEHALGLGHISVPRTDDDIRRFFAVGYVVGTDVQNDDIGRIGTEPGSDVSQNLLRTVTTVAFVIGIEATSIRH